MKKMLCLILCALLALPAFAMADILWEPENDSFYRLHSEEMQSHYYARRYVANGKSGAAPIFTSPNGSKKDELTNGETIWVTWTYTKDDGSMWAYASHESDELGWVNLYDFLLLYDSAQFTLDHADEIREDSISLYERCGGQEIIMWTYPMSGTQASDYRLNDYGDLTINQVYTDPEGKEWGYVGYWRGRWNAWICLDDPANENLTAAPVEPMDTGAPAYDEPSSLPLPLIGGGLSVAAVGAAAAIIKCKKKKAE